MDEQLKEALARVRVAAEAARRLVEAAAAAGVRASESSRRRHELERLEDVGRSAVLECLERGQGDVALQAARDLAEAIDDEGHRAARDLARARSAARPE